jgi:hypothetical protein
MFLSFLGIQRYIICENPSYGTKDMIFARFAYNLTIKTKIGNNWKSQRDVVRSGWPIPLRADRARWPLDLNEICGLDRFPWELTGEEDGGHGGSAAVTGDGCRRYSATADGGRWAAGGWRR